MISSGKCAVWLAGLRSGLVAIAVAVLILLLQYPLQRLGFAVWGLPAFRSTLLLKGNILIRFVALISVYAIFTHLSAALETTILAENGLLLQIALLSQFTVNSVGLAPKTLIGNCKGKGEIELMMPVLYTSVVPGLLISLPFTVLPVLFSEFVFGLLTSHVEVSHTIHLYVLWLLPLLSLTAVAFVLEGYFIGLKAGAVLRNSALTALRLGSAPVAISGWYLQSNHLLWTALTVYMFTLMVILSWQFLKNRQGYSAVFRQT